MKAIQQHGYGEPAKVLRLIDDAPLPDLADDHVLVRTQACSVNPADWHLVYGEPLLMRPALGGVRAPRRVIGTDFAGVIEQVGSAVTSLRVGDKVYGYASGAFAEHVAAPAASTARKPSALTFAEAAAVPLAGITAQQGLRLGGLEARQHVLILGASGGVGTFAVQLAKHIGAEVTGVCSTGRTNLVRRLGAEHVIDYTVQSPANSDTHYDLILQLGGTYSAGTLRRALTPRGTLVQSMGDGSRWFGPLGAMAGAAARNIFVRQRLTTLMTKETAADLDELRDLIDAGAVRPVIDSEFPLEQAADAVNHVRYGHPSGKVVLTAAA